MREGALPGEGLRARPEPHRTALHEHDRMVAVLARHGRRQPQHVLDLRPARDLLEADGGEMVALVDDEMAVVGDDVVHLVAAHEALNDGNVYDACGLAPAAADLPDGGGGQIQERPEPRDPLVHELAAVNQNEGVGSAGGQQRCRDDCLAERGSRRQHAGVMLQQGIGGRRLLRRQFAEECCLNRTARKTLVSQVKPNAELFEQVLHRCQAAARKRDVVRKEFGAGDDAGRVVGRAPHCLRGVEGRVLEGRESHEPVDQPGWQALARNVNLVSQHRADALG